jgi:TctA family transporter
MILCRWPRAPLVLGFVLARIAENNFYISTIRYGTSWLLRPVVLILIAMTLVVVFYPLLRLRNKPAAVKEPE